MHAPLLQITYCFTAVWSVENMTFLRKHLSAVAASLHKDLWYFQGHSGVSMQTLQQLIDAFNASCLPWVPEQGTVGASGDLAPLSHLALGLMGEGKNGTICHVPKLVESRCYNKSGTGCGLSFLCSFSLCAPFCSLWLLFRPKILWMLRAIENLKKKLKMT